MNAKFYKEQILNLIEMDKNGHGDEADGMTSLQAADLLDPMRLSREQAMFRRLPLLVAHSSELEKSGSYVVAPEEYLTLSPLKNI